MPEEDVMFFVDDKKSLVNKVINYILDGIRNHKYKSGDRLPPEPAIMKTLDVSRGTVREAMKILSALGIISIRRGEGTFISEAKEVPVFTSVIYSLLLSEADIQDILDFRVQIDLLAVSSACMRCTESEIIALENSVKEMRELYEQGQYEMIAEKDMQFHLDVVNCTKNPFTINLLTGLYRFFGPEFVYKSDNKYNFEEAERSHLEVIKCLRTQNYAAFINSQKQHSAILTGYFKE